MTQPTEQYVRQLRDSALAFEELLNHHLDERRKFEPKLETFYPNDGDHGDYDIHGEAISIEWQHYDHCGDVEYYALSFPLSDLWDPSWKEREEAKTKG